MEQTADTDWPITIENDQCLQMSTPDMVDHPSTNRAQRRLTLLIQTYVLPLCQTVILDIGITLTLACVV